MKGIKLQLLGLGIIGTAITLAMDIFIGFLRGIGLLLITIGFFVK